MTQRLLLVLTLVVMTVPCQRPVAAGGLRKVWEFDLKRAVRETTDHSTILPVFALRFSPDGRQVAVVVHLYKSASKAADRLLVIHTEHPEMNAREFEIAEGVRDDVNGNGRLSLIWTASGDSMVSFGKVIPVAEERICKIPIQGESSSSHDSKVPLEGRTVRILILDAACRANQTLELPEDWYIADISADRRLLCVRQRNDVLIVDPISGKTIRTWPVSDVSGLLQFADNDKAVCEASTAERPGRVPVTCWDLGSGQKIGEAPTINGGLPSATAAHASRILASDYSHVSIPFTSEYKEVFKRRVVWDFRTGKELASWRPDSQQYEAPGIVNPPLQIREPYNFAISPDGQYIAEGGNGVLRLYRIEP